MNFIILVVLFKIVQVHAKNPPIITTQYGKVEGLWRTSNSGRQYAVFEGIPYAKPPVGELRFEEPQPALPWPGIWKATKVNRCIQESVFHFFQLYGEEDCLYINIYVPHINNATNPMAVIVFIHGGGFFEGYGSEWTNTKYIMNRDIVFVTFHYRLGALGFLSTGDKIVPGNNGMKDQSLALKWIQENIKDFGGDPSSVTIAGFSSGSASVHLHYFSPLSRNLFHKGMSISGSALNAFALQKNPEQRAKALGRLLGCDTTNNRVMVDCLKTRPAHLILQMTSDVLQPHPLISYVVFPPVVEIGSENPFLEEHPYSLLQQGKVHDVPWMFGLTTHEGMFLSLMLLNHTEMVDKNWTSLSKVFFQYMDTIPDSKETEIAEKIRDFYFPGGQTIDNTKLEQLTQMWSDRGISADTILAGQMQSNVNKAPVYFYQFEYQTRQSFIFWESNVTGYPGVAHGDDMPYFFGAVIAEPLTLEEIKMQNIALDILSSFAYEGKPKVPGVIWLPVAEEVNYLAINGPNDIKMKTKTNFTAEKFWWGLGLLENANLFPGHNKTKL